MLPIRALSPTLPEQTPRAMPAGTAQFAIIGDTLPSPAISATAASVPLEALLAVQEADASGGKDSCAARDRRAKRHGRALLEALGGLQRGLLSADGSVSPEVLQRLQMLIADPVPAADPALGAVVAQIALRARIELARYCGTD